MNHHRLRMYHQKFGVDGFVVQSWLLDCSDLVWVLSASEVMTLRNQSTEQEESCSIEHVFCYSF